MLNDKFSLTFNGKYYKLNISYSDILQIALAVVIFALLAFVVFKSTRTVKEVEPEVEILG